MPEPERIILPMVDTPVQPVAPFATSAASQKNGGRSRRIFLPERAISVLLTISCLAFLLGSSILAFVLLGKHTTQASPAIWTSPTVVSTHNTFVLSGKGFGDKSLMLFTYDTDQMFFNAQGYPLETHTNSQGDFTLRIQVPTQWKAGTHLIHVTDEAKIFSVSTKIIVR